MLLHSASTQLHGQVWNESYHELMLAGSPLHFSRGIPAEMRQVPGSWIEEAAKKSIIVDIDNAIISGPLNLQHADIQQPLILANCTFAGHVDISDSIFESEVLVSGAVFLDTVIASETLFKHGIYASNAQSR